MTSNADERIARLEQRVAELEARTQAVEFALVAVVKPALEEAGGLGERAWHDALMAGAARFRALIVARGGAQLQADPARYIEELARQGTRRWSPTLVTGSDGP